MTKNLLPAVPLFANHYWGNLSVLIWERQLSQFPSMLEVSRLAPSVFLLCETSRSLWSITIIIVFLRGYRSVISWKQYLFKAIRPSHCSPKQSTVCADCVILGTFPPNNSTEDNLEGAEILQTCPHCPSDPGRGKKKKGLNRWEKPIIGSAFNTTCCLKSAIRGVLDGPWAW